MRKFFLLPHGKKTCILRPRNTPVPVSGNTGSLILKRESFSSTFSLRAAFPHAIPSRIRFLWKSGTVSCGSTSEKSARKSPGSLLRSAVCSERNASALTLFSEHGGVLFLKGGQRALRSLMKGGQRALRSLIEGWLTSSEVVFRQNAVSNGCVTARLSVPISSLRLRGTVTAISKDLRSTPIPTGASCSLPAR